MNNADMAARMGMKRAAATGAVDSVFVAIGEALVKGEEVRVAGLGCSEPGTSGLAPGGTLRPAW